LLARRRRPSRQQQQQQQQQIPRATNRIGSSTCAGRWPPLSKGANDRGFVIRPRSRRGRVIVHDSSRHCAIDRKAGRTSRLPRHPSRCHSREGGLCFTSAQPNIQRLQRDLSRTSFPRRRALLYFGSAEYPEASASSLQSVIPAKAGIQRLQHHLSRTSFPRKRESRDFSVMSPERHSRESGNPETSVPSHQNVIPAKAGIQRLQCHLSRTSFPRTRESSDFKRSRTKGPGFPPSRE